MEAPVSSESEEESDDESLCILQEVLEDDEVDINIHFHCEHCIKLSKCRERPKLGWSCDIIECFYGCGIRFHGCKLEEHELLCSHMKVPCLNTGNGCPHVMQRRAMSTHLAVCPASIIVCNAEWNRWALGARERERISSAKGVCSLFEVTDLDMAFAINDQKLVNEMHSCPLYLRALMCNEITRRFPSLPLTVRGSYHKDDVTQHLKNKRHPISAADDDEEGLTPGLSLSVCSELLKGKRRAESGNNPMLMPDGTTGVPSSPQLNYTEGNKNERVTRKLRLDDISAFCCSHGILKDLCYFCRDDPEEPAFKFNYVWREKIDLKNPGKISWVKEARVEKIRKQGPLGLYTYKPLEECDEEDVENCISEEADNSKGRPMRKLRLRTPPPTPLTPKGLVIEVGLKHYSRHQVKPKAMFTFQCMQEFRRDEFESHYLNMHCEIQEGLDGWLIQRCPLHIIGCPFSVIKLAPTDINRNVIFCHFLRTFGVASFSEESPVVEKSTSISQTSHLKTKGLHDNAQYMACGFNAQYMACGGNITLLPFEVLQRIAKNLDGFSLNNLSVTCRLMREVCFTLLNEKGIIIQEWIRNVDEGKIHWKLGKNKWFFPKSFECVRRWIPKNISAISNHLINCPFNNRKYIENKFCYLPQIADEIKRQYKNMQKKN